jgi:hypothetical protein
MVNWHIDNFRDEGGSPCRPGLLALHSGVLPIGGWVDPCRLDTLVTQQPLDVRTPTSRPSEAVEGRTASVVGQTDALLTRACRARVTFSRMSLAVFVQMKGLGSSL